MIRKWVFFCGIVLSTSSIAEIDTGTIENGRGNIDSGEITELNSVIIDRTMTLGGREFARNFSNFWRMAFPNMKVVVTIKEFASAKSGSQIFVQYGSETLQELKINGRNGNNRQQAEAVAFNVSKKIQRIKLTEALNPDVDLASDEI